MLDQRRTATIRLSSMRSSSPTATPDRSRQLRSSRLALAPVEREPVSCRMSRMTTLNRRQIVEGIQAASDKGLVGRESGLGLRLDALGLSSLEMEGDGNCQFRALADQLFGHQKHHAIVRQAAVEQMRRNAEFFGMYFEDSAEFTAYLRDMARSPSLPQPAPSRHETLTQPLLLTPTLTLAPAPAPSSAFAPNQAHSLTLTPNSDPDPEPRP